MSTRVSLPCALLALAGSLCLGSQVLAQRGPVPMPSIRPTVRPGLAPALVPRGVPDRAAEALLLPDLVIEEFRATDRASLGEGGAVEIPFYLNVKNVGRGSAGSFKVSAHVRTHELGDQSAGLRVPREGAYPTCPGLAAGASWRITGHVVLARELQGRFVNVHATADSSAGEEFGSRGGLVREMNELNNASRAIALTLPLESLPVNPGLAATPALPAPRVAPLEDWHVRFDNCLVANTTESSGDEPYFIMLGYRAKFFERGSAKAWWSGDLRELADDAPAGRSIRIPDSMGLVAFPRVQRLSVEEYEAGKLPEVVGCVLIAMESDNTPFGEIRDLANRLQRELERKLEEVVARGDLGRLTDPDAETRVVAELTARLTPELGELIRLAIVSAFDGDDVVKVAPFSFLCVNDDLAARLTSDFRLPRPIMNLQTIGYTPERPLRLAGDEGRWELTGVVAGRPSR